MKSIRSFRIANIILAVAGLVGIVVTLCLQGLGGGKDSHKREMIYAEALRSIDSIFVANEKDPAAYAEFKEAASSLTPADLESECFRMMVSKDMKWKEDYYARALVERYSPDMSLEDKTRVVKILNNLGCIYSDNNNPEAAYYLLKTGYEMCKDFDKSKRALPAFLCNMAGIFKNYGDYDTANRLFLESVQMSYSPEYSPSDSRVSESAKIQTLIEYLQFAWMTDRLVSNRSDYEKYMGRLPKSTYEHYQYADFLCRAVDSYVAGDYHGSSELLDSAFRTSHFSFSEFQYRGLGKLFQADAMFHAYDYPKMEKYLAEAEDIIRKNNLIYLYSDLYKGKTAYLSEIGDSVGAAVSKSKGLAVNDSLFSHRNYAALRDIQSHWDRTWAEIEMQQVRKTTFWLVISVICLVVGIVCLALSFRPGMSRKSNISESPDKEPSGRDESDSKEEVADIKEEAMDSKEEVNDSREEETDSKEEELVSVDDVAVSGDDSTEEESEESMRALYAEVFEALAKSPNVYNVDFSLSSFAAESGISSRRISRSVNVCSGGNFSSLLAEIRVRKACEILDSAKTPWERPTMDALAQMVGYKSRAHLSRVFKAVMGMPPTDYVGKTAASE